MESKISIRRERRLPPWLPKALFVTQKTVEVHLSSVYRKLDIASRSQLSKALTVER